MEEARSALSLVVMNGGAQTFLKSQTSGRMLEVLRELVDRGYLERATETSQTVTYRVSQSTSYLKPFRDNSKKSDSGRHKTPSV